MTVGRLRSVDLEQRQIGGRIDADQLGRPLAAVREDHRDLLQRALAEDVVVGQHVAVAADDHAGAGALAALRRERVLAAEEVAEERVDEPPLAVDLHGGDVDHRRRRPRRDLGEVGQAGGGDGPGGLGRGGGAAAGAAGRCAASSASRDCSRPVRRAPPRNPADTRAPVTSQRLIAVMALG